MSEQVTITRAKLDRLANRVAAATGAAPPLTIDEMAAVVGDVETYDGAYAIAPTDEAQHIPTAGKRMTEDLVIGPIPSNYGRITWDGHSIRVS